MVLASHLRVTWWLGRWASSVVVPVICCVGEFVRRTWVGCGLGFLARAGRRLVPVADRARRKKSSRRWLSHKAHLPHRRRHWGVAVVVVGRGRCRKAALPAFVEVVVLESLLLMRNTRLDWVGVSIQTGAKSSERRYIGQCTDPTSPKPRPPLLHACLNRGPPKTPRRTVC